MVTEYSQAGQDTFVLSLIDSNDGEKHTFVDIGCWLPKNLNNTFLLEQNGWDGVSLDITNLRSEWEIRKSKFICDNALSIDYQKLFDDNKLPKVIDYLNLDIEGNGDRYLVLDNVMKSDREFKIITIEHDKYRGYEQTEKIPQVNLLTKLGYTLVCSDVCLNGNPFEDWWVNSNYVKSEKWEKLLCSNKEADEILKLL